MINPENRRKEIRTMFGISYDECLMMFAGSLTEERNLDEIILYMALEETGDTKLMVVGDGPWHEELVKLVDGFELNDRVIFTGMIQPCELGDYYSAGDIFVSGSFNQTQCFPCILAMTYGLVPLCRHDKCLDDVIVNKINGYMYTSGYEFSKYLNILCANPQLRRQMAEKAMHCIDFFSEICLML